MIRAPVEEMNTNQQLTIDSRIVVAKRGELSAIGARRRWFWLALLIACGVGGLASGITGLVLSFLAFCEVLTRSRDLSLVVTSLIVASLGLLLFGAHAMDRVDEAEADSDR